MNKQVSRPLNKTLIRRTHMDVHECFCAWVWQGCHGVQHLSGLNVHSPVWIRFCLAILLFWKVVTHVTLECTFVNVGATVWPYWQGNPKVTAYTLERTLAIVSDFVNGWVVILMIVETWNSHTCYCYYYYIILQTTICKAPSKISAISRLLYKHCKK